ncbi:S-adenosyl-L-methionine-dependent methyltransferase [Echria macrotheca]|uniref:S-adenosyl-L-methionine-dependent methyltransferase n=1 Tax=Echria macrotheca TaxID=438768 RepID=A0AAJ0B6Q9_9PEZI|nr:S-adenosyl-L-methionine-dependent methyltransferase [Echria macrotheca]
MTTNDPVTVLENIIEQAQTLSADDRRRLLVTAQKLVTTLEPPEEAAFRQIFQSHTFSFAIRLGAELGFFRVLVKRDGVPISSVELATECKIEELLLVRVMRVLTGLGYAAESGEREYVATPLSRAMVLPHLEAFMIHSQENSARVVNRLPEYFQRYGYKCPTDGANGAYQFALGTSLSFFDSIHSDPVRAERFNVSMTGNKNQRRFWFEWFPVDDHLLKPFHGSSPTPESVFLVDMGGGKGHHLEALLTKFPAVGGHLILQDLPRTISSIRETLDSRIQPAVHDIFSPQPVAGALVYYTHFVLHDFPDDKCQTMLRHVAAAMRPGYSRLLLNEVVIPERDCPLYFACSDITMMAVLAGMQRSRRHWVELVESAGLAVVKVWESPDFGDMEGVIEAMVAN